MKVIVQDLLNKTFLSTDGRWVAGKADAGDFLTLLRAYHFARINTAREFEVILYCPEDDYSASIITGVGISDSNVPIGSESEPSEPIEIKVEVVRSRFIGQCHSRRSLPVFDQTKNYLN